MASCCSSTFNLSSFFTLFAFSLSYFDMAFLLYFPYFHNFHILLHCLFFLLNNTFFILFLTSFFEVHSLEMGSHVSYMQWSTFFILLNILSQKFHQSSVCSSYTCFLHPFFHANVWLHVTHTKLFFMGILVAVVS